MDYGLGLAKLTRLRVACARSISASSAGRSRLLSADRLVPPSSFLVRTW